MSFLHFSTKLREIEGKIDKSEVDDCGCLSENIGEGGLESLRLWHFPILCTIINPIAIFFLIMFAFTHAILFFHLVGYIIKIGEDLGCWWVPEKNSFTLTKEIATLQPIIANTLFDNIQKGLASDSDCGCGSDNSDEREVGSLRLWHFPILCTILYPLFEFFVTLGIFTQAHIFGDIAAAIYALSEDLGCWWTRIPGF